MSIQGFQSSSFNFGAFQSQLRSSPTEGFGYLVRPGDVMQQLLSQAYGAQGMGVSDPFMAMNSHIGAGGFQDLSSVIGQMMMFPQLAQLQQLQQMQQAGMNPAQGFAALDQFVAQSGMGPSQAAELFAAMGAQLPGGDPMLAGLVQHMMATGMGMPGSSIGQQARLLEMVMNGDIDPSALLAGAQEAVREGRTTAGTAGTRATPGAVDQALGESWTPASRPVSNGVKPMSQLDYNDRLGNGSRTIRQAGCFMTAMAMASTKITGNTNMDPRKANQLIRANGGFAGSGLNSGRAANALGMKLTERGAWNGASGRKLDAALNAGRPVVAGVDYKAGKSSSFSNADHFITITGRNADGSYSAVDPAGGKNITLKSDGHGRLVGGKYTVSELCFLDKR